MTGEPDSHHNNNDHNNDEDKISSFYCVNNEYLYNCMPAEQSSHFKALNEHQPKIFPLPHWNFSAACLTLSKSGIKYP